jgi:oligopeptide transport system ATP-binding protein
MSDTLLSAVHLTKYFPVGRALNPFAHARQFVHAVDDVSFDVRKGETLALVGESGCGKTTTARLIVRLYNPTHGTVLFKGQDIFSLKGHSLKTMRRQVQMVFQDPYASLNPRRTAGQTIEEPLIIHNHHTKQERKDLAIDTLRAVGLQDEHYDRLPSEFSGGQRQRIGIARALILRPELVIADEPVSALDVSVRAQIVNLLKDLQTKFDLTYIFVAHDLSLVRYIADRVAIMYMGKIVEMAEKEEFYTNPLHPYTKALLSAVPVPDPEVRKEKMKIPSEMPNPAAPPPGCRFNTRCPFKFDRCVEEEPILQEVKPGHLVSCHLTE